MLHDAMGGFPLEREKYKVFVTENTWVPAEFTQKTVEEYADSLMWNYEQGEQYEDIVITHGERQIHHIKSCDNTEWMKLVLFEATTREIIEYDENEVDEDVNTYTHYALFYEGNREEWVH